MNSQRAGLLHDAVDRQKAEAFQIDPAAAPGSPADINARPVSDPIRVTATFSGIWAAPSVRAPIRPDLSPRDASGGASRQISSGRPTVKYADSALPWRPLVGDRVTRTATGEVCSVAELHGDGYGRTVMILTAQG